MKQFAVREVDEKDEARDDMEVPEEVSVDLYIPEKLGKEVTTKGDPIVGTGRGEVS
jgi:hypothetical protein